MSEKRTFDLSRLADVCTDAIDKAVYVPDPNVDTDLHLALIEVGDLRMLRQLARNAADKIQNS